MICGPSAPSAPAGRVRVRQVLLSASVLVVPVPSSTNVSVPDWMLIAREIVGRVGAGGQYSGVIAQRLEHALVAQRVHARHQATAALEYRQADRSDR